MGGKEEEKGWGWFLPPSAHSLAILGGRLLLKLVVQSLCVTRTLRSAILGSRVASSLRYYLLGEGVDSHVGSHPQALDCVALVLGDTLVQGREDREKVTMEVIPALCRAIRWFDSSGVRNIILYDSKGCLKTPWATESLRRGLEEDASGQEGLKCTIKLLCEEDWHDCISEFTARCGNEATKAKAKDQQKVFDAWIESYHVTELEVGSHGRSSRSRRPPSLGRAPEIILVFSDGSFTLAGFFPWYTKLAEIYQVKSLRSKVAAKLESELKQVTKAFFSTKQRFGV